MYEDSSRSAIALGKNDSGLKLTALTLPVSRSFTMAFQVSAMLGASVSMMTSWPLPSSRAAVADMVAPGAK